MTFNHRKLIRAVRGMWRKLHFITIHWREWNAYLAFCQRTQPGMEGSVQPKELLFLKELVLASHEFPGPIIEVGTLFGFTTQAMASWKQEAKELITIDDYSWNPVGMLPAAHRAFTQRILFYLAEKCHTLLFEGLSSDFYRTYHGTRPSMIFIDASHEYEHVKADIRWAQDQGVPIICGHDYSPHWPGVQRAVEESFGTNFRCVETLWAFQSSLKL